MSLTITPAGASTVTYSDFIAAFYRTAGKYWQLVPNVKPWTFKRLTQSAPLVDGRTIKRFGKDLRQIDRLQVWYVATTAAGVITAFNADAAAVINKACSLSLPLQGGSLPACECSRFELVPSGGSQRLIQGFNGAFFRAKAILAFDQLRES